MRLIHVKAAVLALLALSVLATFNVLRAPTAVQAATVVFSDGFEGTWPGSWYCGDNDAASGYDYWGRTSNAAHTGSYGVWCAQVGGAPYPSYDLNMEACMYRTVSLSGYSSATLTYWYRVQCDDNTDALYVYYRVGSQWYSTDPHTGNSGGWVYSSVSIRTDVDAVGFRFHSDSMVAFGTGACVDDVQLSAVSPGYSATIWGWDYIYGWQIPVPITMDGVATGYSTPHTFTGLTGTHTFTVPSKNSVGHPFSDWSTDWTDETIIVSSEGTYTARYRAGYSVTVWAWCASESQGWISRPITKDGASTGYSTPHTFAGLTGTHTFTVPSTDALGHTFYEWNTGLTSRTLTVSSAGVYTARYKLVSASLTVTSPNGGQKWVRGTTHSITWSSSGSPGSYVKIELMKGGVVNKVITSSTANDGSYSWTISSTQTLGTDYKVRITSTSKPSITDSSNSNFAIVRGTLTVTSPNGGESWRHGTTHTITWSKSGSTGSYVKIELLKGGVVNRVITSSTANDGSYSWTIPSTQTLGTDYKIRITSTSYSSISDSSNSNFYIIT